MGCGCGYMVDVGVGMNLGYPYPYPYPWHGYASIMMVGMYVGMYYLYSIGPSLALTCTKLIGCKIMYISYVLQDI